MRAGAWEAPRTATQVAHPGAVGERNDLAGEGGFLARGGENLKDKDAKAVLRLTPDLKRWTSAPYAAPVRKAAQPTRRASRHAHPGHAGRAKVAR
jgi:hypothetical protein